MIVIPDVHPNGLSYRVNHYLEHGRRINPTKPQPWISLTQMEKLCEALAAAPQASTPTTTTPSPSHTCRDPDCACHSLPPPAPKVFEVLVERERQRGLRA